MPLYRHTPLNLQDGEIRLLKVQGRRSITSEPLYSMVQVPIDEARDNFIAVSHIWGYEDHTLEIMVDERSFLVSPQLWQFLNLATDRLPNCQLWIDAICINQNDITEKHEQVPRMGQIYAAATRLVGFLPSYVEYMSESEDSTSSQDFVVDRTSHKHNHYGRLSMSSTDETLAVIRLLFHEFWSRIWIIQELRLTSSREFWWEGQVWTSEALEDLASRVMDCTGHSRSELYTRLWSRVIGPQASRAKPKAAASLLDHMESSSNGRSYTFACTNAEADLVDLVIKHSSFQCTEPEDRIYGLLGLAKNRRSIEVRYGISPPNLFMDLYSLNPKTSQKHFDDLCRYVGIDWNRTVEMERNSSALRHLLYGLRESLYEVGSLRVRMELAKMFWPERRAALKSARPSRVKLFSNFRSLRYDHNEEVHRELCSLLHRCLKIPSRRFVFFPGLGLAVAITKHTGPKSINERGHIISRHYAGKHYLSFAIKIREKRIPEMGMTEIEVMRADVSDSGLEGIENRDWVTVEFRGEKVSFTSNTYNSVYKILTLANDNDSRWQKGLRWTIPKMPSCVSDNVKL